MEFNQLAMANADGSDDMLNRVMTKDNIGLAALLQFREGIFENGIIPAYSPEFFIMFMNLGSFYALHQVL